VEVATEGLVDVGARGSERWMVADAGRNRRRQEGTMTKSRVVAHIHVPPSRRSGRGLRQSRTARTCRDPEPSTPRNKAPRIPHFARTSYIPSPCFHSHFPSPAALTSSGNSLAHRPHHHQHHRQTPSTQVLCTYTSPRRLNSSTTNLNTGPQHIHSSSICIRATFRTNSSKTKQSQEQGVADAPAPKFAQVHAIGQGGQCA
jgi:hypothetical protein